MKVMITGFEHSFGTSKAGSPYVMRQLFALRPVQPMSKPNRTVNGFGFTQTELEVSEQCDLAPIQAVRFPAMATLELGHELSYGGARAVVTAFKDVKSLVA